MARAKFSTLVGLSLSTLLLGACAPVGSPIDLEGLPIPLIDPGSAEEVGVLAFLNDSATNFALLDVDVGLDRRAAQNLIDARPFASIEEVDAVKYVGRVALARLLEWARDGGWLTPADDTRARAILGLVNDSTTTFALLDVDVGLDSRAARGLVDGRPFDSLDAIDAVSYVGASALDKLGAYGLAHGYDGGPTAPEAPCVVISEYVEGAGANNKAVEIYNCGSSPVPLEQVGICLVRNDDTTCSSHARAGTGSLAPGAVWTMCRTRGGTFNDPYAALAAACDAEIGGAAIFSGDDRLVLFADANDNARFDAEDTVLDNFGDPTTRPSASIWSEIGLRRCNLSPVAFDTDDYFVGHPRTDLAHLGVPPSESCTISHLGSRGDDCIATEYCEAGLTCMGRPSDGSTLNGKCVRPDAGTGRSCDRYTPCPSEERCAGWTLWGEGTCVAGWMADRFMGATTGAIPESPSHGVYSSAVVYGLASVPVDIEVQVHIVHPRMTDLRVTLTDPNGDSAVLWDRSPELSDWSRSFVPMGISRDDEVNGRWTLHVEDLVTGETGELRHFQLFIVSRFD